MRAQAAVGSFAAAFALALLLAATPAQACVPPSAYLHFPPGDAHVTDAHHAVLEGLILAPARTMPASRSRYDVTGYADSAEAYDPGLSRRRAEAVRDYLLSVGVPRDQIELTFRGETGRLVDTEQLDGNNRAVTVDLSNPDYPLRCP